MKKIIGWIFVSPCLLFVLAFFVFLIYLFVMDSAVRISLMVLFGIPFLICLFFIGYDLLGWSFMDEY